MIIRKYCEYCTQKGGNASLQIYTNGEERCPKCRGYLISYSSVPKKSATVSTSQSSIVSNSGMTTPSNGTTHLQSVAVGKIPVVNTNSSNPVTGTTNGNSVTPSSNGKKTISSKPSNPVRQITTVQPQQKTQTNTTTTVTTTQKNASSTQSVVREAFEKRHLIGMESVCCALEKVYAEWSTEEFKKALHREAKEDRTIGRMNIFVVGEEITGKSEVARIVAEVLNQAGLRSNFSLERIRLKDFETAMCKDEDLDDLFKKHKGKTVLVEDALDEAFMDKDGEIVVDVNKVNDILHAMRHLGGDVTLILEMSPALKDALYVRNPRLNDFFYPLVIPQYNDEDLLKLIKKRITEDFKYLLTDDAVEQLNNRIKRTSFDGYSQGRFILDVWKEACDKLEDRMKENKGATKEERYTFVKSDIQNKTFDQKKAKEILAEIDARTGQAEIKAYAHKIYDLAVKNEQRIQNGKHPLNSDQPNFYIEAEPGAGKTTSCIILACLLKACGMLSDDELFIVSVAELQTSAVGGTPEQVRKVFAKAKGKLLVIDEAYALAPSENGVSGNYGQEVVDTITNELGKPGKDVIVVLIGYPNSIDPVLKMNKGMPRRFPNKITIEDYSLDEMTDIFIKHLRKNGYSLEDGAEVLIRKMIDSRRRKENFGNAGGVINLADDLMNANTNEREIITRMEILEIINTSPGSNVDAILNELESLIGIAEVKLMVKTLVMSLKGRAKQIQAGKTVSDPESYNLIFKGPPGTGKTTVSRLIAKLFSEVGILKYSDKIIEKDGKDFIAGYTGQTEEKVSKILQEAYGGILYIDEVYEMDNGTEFGKSAINALCKGLDARKQDLIVIISGYEKETQQFLDNNPGLQSRFVTTILFPSYSVDELYRIFQNVVYKKDARCEESKAFEKHIKEWIETNMHNPNFGNGREMRNLAEKCITNLQKRIGQDDEFPSEEMDLIREIDIPGVA